VNLPENSFQSPDEMISNGENPFPEIIDWEITSRCNLNCKFCFGPDPRIYKSKELDTPTIERVAKMLASKGVKRIVITGGEPLLRNDIVPIIKSFNSLGLKIHLSTNGYYIKDIIGQIASFLDWIAIPFDGSNPITSQEMRCDENHHQLTLENIKLINQYGLNIKIGTIVTRCNYDDLMNIALLLDMQKFNIWKLYQFSPRDKGRAYKREISLDSDEFEQYCMDVIEAYPHLNIFYSLSENRDQAYFLILPDGNVVTPIGETYYEIGNLLSDPEKVQIKWRKYIDSSRLLKNFQRTFPD
jgi:MoaA/NifB/PqqE/SkfB family radical SAM enzyme